jgi:hypothetical protein
MTGHPATAPPDTTTKAAGTPFPWRGGVSERLQTPPGSRDRIPAPQPAGGRGPDIRVFFTV